MEYMWFFKALYNALLLEFLLSIWISFEKNKSAKNWRCPETGAGQWAGQCFWTATMACSVSRESAASGSHHTKMAG